MEQNNNDLDIDWVQTWLFAADHWLVSVWWWLEEISNIKTSQEF